MDLYRNTKVVHYVVEQLANLDFKLSLRNNLIQVAWKARQQIKKDAMDDIHEMKAYLKPKSSLVEPFLKNNIRKARLWELLCLPNN